MKKYITIFMLLLAFSGIAQTLNNYKYVVVPLRFTVQDSENQYRLNTILKKYLVDAGFDAVYENQQTDEIANNRCNNLYADVVKVKSVFSVKTMIVFKDCKNAVVYTSPEGTSKEKNYEKGYLEALVNAAAALPKLKYKYDGTTAANNPQVRATQSASVRPLPATPPPPAPAMSNSNPDSGTVYIVETVATGYLIINSQNSTIALRAMTTSNPKVFIASNATAQGVLIREGEQWFFEYYKEGKLYSEVFKVKL